MLEALTPRSDVPCNLSWSTNKLQTLVLFVNLMFLLLYSCAGMAELADAADSKSAEVHPSWGFNSPSRHQISSKDLVNTSADHNN